MTIFYIKNDKKSKSANFSERAEPVRRPQAVGHRLQSGDYYAGLDPGSMNEEFTSTP